MKQGKVVLSFCLVVFFQAKQGVDSCGVGEGFRCSDIKNRVMHTFPTYNTQGLEAVSRVKTSKNLMTCLSSLFTFASNLSVKISHFFPPSFLCFEAEGWCLLWNKEKNNICQGLSPLAEYYISTKLSFLRKINKIGTSIP